MTRRVSKAEPVARYRNLAHRVAQHIVVTDFTCDGRCSTSRVREEATAGHEIAITRRGAWTRHDTHGRHLADATRAILFNRGAPYRIDHPVHGGDHCLAIQYGDSVLALAAEELGIGLRRDEAPFSVPWVVATARMQLLAARLFARLARRVTGTSLEQVACEELALELLAEALRGLATRKHRPHRERATHARQRELVHATEIEIARHFADELNLDTLARRLGCSPFHLARMFRRYTGDTIHRRLMHLRIASALTRLADGTDAVGTIAHEIGFADHSHLTAMFVRRFGLSPSAFRHLDDRAEITLVRSLLRARHNGLEQRVAAFGVLGESR